MSVTGNQVFFLIESPGVFLPAVDSNRRYVEDLHLDLRFSQEGPADGSHLAAHLVGYKTSPGTRAEESAARILDPVEWPIVEKGMPEIKTSGAFSP